MYSIISIIFNWTFKAIELEENKLKAQIKQLAKKGDKSSISSAKTLALELVKSRKAKERLYKSKAQLNSVSMTLTTNLGILYSLTVFIQQ